jgi:hypothetical protein
MGKYDGKTIIVKKYKKGAGVKYPNTKYTSRFGSLEDAIRHAESFEDMGATIRLIDGTAGRAKGGYIDYRKGGMVISTVDNRKNK